MAGQIHVARQAEVQLHGSDEVGVSATDGPLEQVLGVLVVDHLRHPRGCLAAHPTTPQCHAHVRDTVATALPYCLRWSACSTTLPKHPTNHD